MRRAISSLAGVALFALTVVVPTSSPKAENGQITAGIAGGLIGGILLGGALAGRPPPVYYAPAPVYVEEPVCRIVREQYWDGYGYRIRRVQVCN